MIYIVDIDGTLCSNTDGDYEQAVPFSDAIERVNGLMDAGHTVILWTARGGTTGKDWSELTRAQLQTWGVKPCEVRFGKPHYDRWIDDKAECW